MLCIVICFSVLYTILFSSSKTLFIHISFLIPVSVTTNKRVRKNSLLSDFSYLVFTLRILIFAHALILIYEPLLLFFNANITVIQFYGIFSFAQRRDTAVRIYIIALFHIFQYVIKLSFHSFSLKFIVTTLCSYFRRGCYKNF